MNLTKVLLGTNGLINEELISGVVLNDRYRRFKIGQPIVITKNSYENKDINTTGSSLLAFTDSISEQEYYAGKGSRNIVVFSYFLHSPGFPIRSKFNIDKRDIVLTDCKGLICKRRIKEIEEFEINKVKDINDFVREENVLTLLINNQLNGSKFIRSINKVLNIFPVSTYCGKTGSSSSSYYKSGDGLSAFVSFYSLPYCIPVFSNNKISGMGIHLGLFWKKQTENTGILHSFSEIFALLSNYKENVVIVDGSVIRECRSIPSDHISYMADMLKNDEHYRKVAESKKNKEDLILKEQAVICSDVSSNGYNNPFDTTAKYYYTYTTTSTSSGTF